MTYKVVFTEKAKKSLKMIDKPTAALIIGWIEKNLEGCTNPKQYGKGIKGDKSGLWRYRVGNYRIISEIKEKEIVILVLNVGHRKDIYK